MRTGRILYSVYNGTMTPGDKFCDQWRCTAYQLGNEYYTQSIMVHGQREINFVISGVVRAISWEMNIVFSL